MLSGLAPLGLFILRACDHGKSLEAVGAPEELKVPDCLAFCGWLQPILSQDLVPVSSEDAKQTHVVSYVSQISS